MYRGTSRDSETPNYRKNVVLFYYTVFKGRILMCYECPKEPNQYYNPRILAAGSCVDILRFNAFSDWSIFKGFSFNF